MDNLGYQPLVEVPNAREFRLIKLHADGSDTLSCELRNYKIHQSPPFRALSYTWKSPFDTTESDDAPTERILVDGKPMIVGVNLVTALKALRDWHGDYEEFIWADAICIDQGNYRERAYQVSIMGEIFGSADAVFVWLGGEAQDSDRALAFMKILAKCHEDLEAGRSKTLAMAHDPRYRAHWTALDALWKRRWWERAWVLQETVLARKADFCCGRTVIRDVDVFNHGRALRDVWDELYNLLGQQYGIYLNMPTFHILDGINRLRTARLRGITFPLLTCHYRTMSSQVTDPRDAIFSKLGMASDGYIVYPSYTQPVHEVYTQFVLDHIRETKSLEIIHLDARPRATANIPSWVPDWAAGFAADPLQPDHGGNPRNKFRYYMACQGEPACAHLGTSNPDIRVLECKGYLFDIVDGVAHAEEDSWAGTEDPRPVSQPRSTKCAYADDKSIFEGLWRAVVMNQDINGDMPASGSDMGSVLADCFCAAEARLAAGEKVENTALTLRFDAYCSWIASFNVFGKTVSQRMAQAATDRPALAIPANVRTDTENAMTNGLTFRRLLTTNGGYFGIGPYETEPGDVVTILLGSSVPVVLRPLESGLYTVVGEAYIHGIMYGEAMDEFRREQLVAKSFCLA